MHLSGQIIVHNTQSSNVLEFPLAQNTAYSITCMKQETWNFVWSLLMQNLNGNENYFRLSLFSMYHIKKYSNKKYIPISERISAISVALTPLVRTRLLKNFRTSTPRYCLLSFTPTSFYSSFLYFSTDIQFIIILVNFDLLFVGLDHTNVIIHFL